MKCKGCGKDRHSSLFEKHHITDTKTVSLCACCHGLLSSVIQKLLGDKAWWPGKTLEELIEAEDEVKEHELYGELSTNLRDILLETWPRACRKYRGGQRDFLDEEGRES